VLDSRNDGETANGGLGWNWDWTPFCFAVVARSACWTARCDGKIQNGDIAPAGDVAWWVCALVNRNDGETPNGDMGLLGGNIGGGCANACWVAATARLEIIEAAGPCGCDGARMLDSRNDESTRRNGGFGLELDIIMLPPRSGGCWECAPIVMDCCSDGDTRSGGMMGPELGGTPCCFMAVDGNACWTTMMVKLRTAPPCSSVLAGPYRLVGVRAGEHQ
jgi:hypothetical protein